MQWRIAYFLRIPGRSMLAAEDCITLYSMALIIMSSDANIQVIKYGMRTFSQISDVKHGIMIYKVLLVQRMQSLPLTQQTS